MLKASMRPASRPARRSARRQAVIPPPKRWRQEEHHHRRNIIACPPATLSRVPPHPLIRSTSSVADDAPPHERHLTTLDITFDKEAHRASSW